MNPSASASPSSSTAERNGWLDSFDRRHERPKGRADLVVHELDGEALLFDPVSMSTHRLNETAVFIWNCCDGQRTVEMIARLLAGRYDVTRIEAEDHVERLLAEFDRFLLLEPSSAKVGDV